MLILILGLALFWAAHLFPRLAPDARAAMGASGRGAIAAALILSTVLMVWGFRIADGPFWWGRNPALVGINNLLVLAGFYLFAAAGMKTRITQHIRHPQLTGFALWAVAHLLVNGDQPSLILFGGLLAWSLTEIIVISRSKPWVPPAGPFPLRKEIMAGAGAVILMAVVAIIHGWLGPIPYGG